MKNHTLNISLKAASIADKTADTVLRTTRDFSKWFDVWSGVYEQVIKELSQKEFILNERNQP